MSGAGSAQECAIRALAAVPGLDGARVVRRLVAGPTNVTWLVEHGARQWVLRLDTSAARELGLDRDNERVVCAEVAGAGIAPAYRFFDTAAGICLRSFVPGRVWTADDLRDAHSLARLADVLRQLHALPVVGSRFDPAAAIRRYARQLGSREAAVLAERALATLQSVWGRGAGRSALCHNDLVAENMIETTDGGLALIDWEYAGVGDPWFDLAIVIRHHGLDERLARPFLDAYLGRAATGGEFTRLMVVCRFYGQLLELWNLRIGNQDPP